MRIGFIGLGHMGVPMVRTLIRAGHSLVLLPGRDAAATAALAQEGATTAPTPRAVAAEVDVLCACRATPEQSVEVFLGAEGAIASGRGDLLCIDLATIDPMTSRRIAAALGQAGIAFLDAPVSGGPAGAAAGTLSIMVGGEPAAFARAEPVLAALGRSVFHMGPAGAGLSAKLCNNLITGTLHVLVAEAMVLGVKAGIEPRRLYEVLHASSARSTTLDRVVPNHFLPRSFEPGSPLVNIIKDLECATATAKALGVRLLLPTVAQQCFVEAAGRGHGAEDLAAVILPMEEIAGVQVGPA